MDEIENQLKIKVRPLSWPINNGPDFKGVYNIFNRSLKLFNPDIQEIQERIKFEDLSDPQLEEYIGSDAEVLREELELVEGIYPEFDSSEYLAGNLAPVFFGSALYNFGVQELLDSFVQIAPSPLPSKAEEREVHPEEDVFSGFVFKIHANT